MPDVVEHALHETSDTDGTHSVTQVRAATRATSHRERRKGRRRSTPAEVNALVNDTAVASLITTLRSIALGRGPDLIERDVDHTILGPTKQGSGPRYAGPEAAGLWDCEF